MRRLVLLICALIAGVYCTAMAQAENWRAPEWLGDLEPIEMPELTVRSQRPRLYITPEELPLLRQRVKSTHREAWERLQVSCGSRELRTRMVSNAFCYLLTGNREQARAAIAAALELAATEPGDDWEATHKVWPEAVVFDWCHDQFTAGERQTLLEGVRAQLHSAGGTSLDTQPPHAGHLVNHMADAHVPAGIAFHDEDPRIFQRAVVVARTQLAAKNVYYRWGISSQGTSYGVTHIHADLRILTEILKATGVDLYPQFPFLRQVGYYWIYARRPDGQILRNGDDWLDHHVQNAIADKSPETGAQPVEYFDRAGTWSSWSLTEALLYAAVMYDDPILFNEYLLVRDLSRHWTAICDIIWRDPKRTASGPQALAPVRYLDGAAGTLMFRTGWGGADDVVGMFKAMPLYVKNHDHLDRLSFQIFCRGALTIDSGLYEGSLSGYDSDHWLQYYQRTIAHNSLLIRDPDEVQIYRGRKVLADGGQRYPRDGDNPGGLESLTERDWHLTEVLSHDVGADGEYAFVSVDAANGYGPKAEMVRRTFVFLNSRGEDAVPAGWKAYFIIHDLVRSANPDHQKVFLLHAVEEPEVHGSDVLIRRTGEKYSGVLASRTLLPGNPVIVKVGGPGREWEVNGVNFPIGEKEGDIEAGAWRLEISTPVQEKATEFLHALAAAPGSGAEPFKASESLQSQRRVVVLGPWTVVLPPADGTISGSEFNYSSPAGPGACHLLMGLRPDAKIKVSCAGQPVSTGNASSGGAFSFKPPASGTATYTVAFE